MRQSEFPVDSIFINRWSPRSFTDEKLPKEFLMSAFEAARWAPSSSNSQPTRFVYSERGDQHWDKFLSFLMEGNRVWAKQAAALIVVLSKKDMDRGGTSVPSASHSFDAGAAWMSFALQMEKIGWMTHGMGGIEHAKIRSELNLPENFHVEAMVAVGKLGERSQLPQALAEREEPNTRRPMGQMVDHGIFRRD